MTIGTLERMALAIVLTDIGGLAIDARPSPDTLDWLKYALHIALAIAILVWPHLRARTAPSERTEP